MQIKKSFKKALFKDIIKKDMDDAYRGLVKPYRIKSYNLISKREVSVVLTEGKNREIRNLFALMGYEVKKLTRIRIGRIHLDDLPTGQYRKLTKAEVSSLEKDAKGGR